MGEIWSRKIANWSWKLQCLPAIPAKQEAQIRRITIRGQSEQKHETPSEK
jgi:hypothetical protein